MKLFFAILLVGVQSMAQDHAITTDAAPPTQAVEPKVSALPEPKVSALPEPKVSALPEPKVNALPEPKVNPPTESNKLVILGVIDRAKKQDFETKILPVLQSEIQSCGDCQIKNFTPYDAQGNFVTDVTLKQQLEAMAKEANVAFVNYNEKLSSSNQVIVDSLKSAQASGHLVVLAAGQPGENESSAPLMMTVAGQVPNALIIGELGERDRLLGSSFYGPEMLTALRPPREKIGQGIAPAIFAGRLTKQFHKKTDWVKYLSERKLANKKLWLELNDCFRTL